MITSTIPATEVDGSTADSSMGTELISMAHSSQQFVEHSIQKFPAISVGVAIAAGVVLGCLFKRR